MKDAIVALVVLGHLTGEEADGVWAGLRDTPTFLSPSVEAKILGEIVNAIRAARPIPAKVS